MYRFYCDCVGWEPNDIERLEGIIDNEEELTLDQFKEVIPRKNIIEVLPIYESGVPLLENDWAIRFAKSVYKGITYYFIRWSGIEYIFIPNNLEL